ncbi:hypothetical protein FGO68_gene5777 [Halteria grandinella]|uniref:Uncharacterized protein n=1 Tax=Halteria grandinella TaxID=5974 RepID=A0A8J8SUK6_HALGN|nr:hypothetical protein FGO68_gene5777 [Halteria grandinella]
MKPSTCYIRQMISQRKFQKCMPLPERALEAFTQRTVNQVQESLRPPQVSQEWVAQLQKQMQDHKLSSSTKRKLRQTRLPKGLHRNLPYKFHNPLNLLCQDNKMQGLLQNRRAKRVKNRVALRKLHQRILPRKALPRKQLHPRRQAWKSKKVRKKDLMTTSDFIKLNLLIMENNNISNAPSDSHPPLEREPTALVRPRKIPVIK